jgi:hypothetical protein
VRALHARVRTREGKIFRHFFEKNSKNECERLDISFKLYYNVMWLTAKAFFVAPKNGAKIF